MYIFVLTLHIVLCCLLVLIILMQPGKGGDVSSAFGGGASTQLFGAAGPGNFLTKGTGAIATLFMVTSITLALYSTDAARSGGDIGGELEDVLNEGEEGAGFGTNAPSTAPPAAPTPAAPAPAAPAPTETAPATPDPAAPAAPAAPATPASPASPTP